MRQTVFAFALFLAILSGRALAGSITVHNTGVDATDALVAAGAQASFWTLSAAPAGATESIGSTPFRYYNAAYFADTAEAAWVSPQSDGNAGAQGDYTYDLVIDLTGLNPDTAFISGTIGSDNESSIWLNDNAAVATTGSDGFSAATPFTINSGFVAGLNTIHMKVNNAGDPTAFFVSFTSATTSPSHQLFTNWSGTIVGGNLWTAGGPCNAACFAIGDNFSNQQEWAVTDITVYVVVAYTGVVQGGGWRYALFTEAGAQVVAPTDTAVTFAYLGNYFDSYDIYKGVISGLNISLPPGEYQFRFTNTQTQGVYPAYGTGASAQTIAPGFVQFTGSPEVEALLGSQDQRDENLAFEISGTVVGKVLEISPGTLDFGSLVENTPSGFRFVTLANIGSDQLSVNSLTTAAAPFQQTTDGTCGSTLPFVIAAGNQCTLSYVFTPAAQEVASQPITVTSDAAGDTAFSLRGSGDAVFANGFEP